MSFDSKAIGYLDSKEFRSKVLTLAQKRLGVIVSTFADGSGGESLNKNYGMLSLLDSTYSSDVPSTNYALQLKALAFESSRFILILNETVKDIHFSTTRGEQITKNIDTFLFPGYQQPRATSTDSQFKSYLLSIVEAYFGGSKESSMEKSLLGFFGVPINLTESYKESTFYDPIKQFSFSILIEADPQIKDLEALKTSVEFIVSLIKPAHTYFQTKYVFKEYNEEITQGYYIATNNNGEELLTPDGFYIPIKSNHTAICDLSHVDQIFYEYGDLREIKKNKYPSDSYIKNSIRYSGFDYFNSSILNSFDSLTFNDASYSKSLNSYNTFKSYEHSFDNLPYGLEPNTPYLAFPTHFNSFITLDMSGNSIVLASKGKGLSYKDSLFLPDNVDTSEDTISITNHGIENRSDIQFFTTGNLPGNLVLNTVYTALVINSNLFKVLDINNNIINITDSGMGSHSVKYAVNTIKNLKTSVVLGNLNASFDYTDVSLLDSSITIDKDAFYIEQVTSANIDTGFNSIILSRYYINETPVRFTTNGILPSGILSGRTYYLKYISNFEYNISESLNGDVLDIIDFGSGVHSIHILSTVTFISGIFSTTLDSEMTPTIPKSLEDPRTWRKRPNQYFILNDLGSVMCSTDALLFGDTHKQSFNSYYSAIEIEAIKEGTESISPLEEASDMFLTLDICSPGTGSHILGSKTFLSSDVDIMNNSIHIESHGFSTMEYVVYQSIDTPVTEKNGDIISPITTLSLFVYKLDNNTIKLFKKLL